MAFGTRFGSTEGVADEIASVLRAQGTSVTVLDLRSEENGDIDGSDLIVVGSGIFMGSWSAGAQRFMEHYGPRLARKRVALFACSGDAVLGRNTPEECRMMYLDDVARRYSIPDPFSMALFGGVIDFDEHMFLVKAVLESPGMKTRMWEKGAYLNGRFDFRDWDEIRRWTNTLVADRDLLPH